MIIRIWMVLAECGIVAGFATRVHRIRGVIEEVPGAVTGVVCVMNRHGCACFV